MESDIDFVSNTEYLLAGNSKQRHAYRVLTEIGIFETLREFNPILVGTVPIDIDIPNSDLDIICEVLDVRKFAEVMVGQYEEMDGFSYSIHTDDVPKIVSRFQYGGWMIEVFGQSIPTQQQNGYRHMIIEDRILKILEPKYKETIRELKKTGWKTEPAFGQLLKFDGNPYEFLLHMYDWEDHEIKQFLRARSLDVV